jgi:hypothetical protein
MILTGKNQRIWRRTCPRATLPTTNPAWTAVDMNPGFSGEKLVTSINIRVINAKA